MTYRSLAKRAVILWGLVALTARLPVAMAPLAMVFLARDSPSGYTLGGTLAAVYVIGEVLGAVVLGSLLRPDLMRIQLAAGMAVGAAAFAAIAVRPSSPVGLLLLLSFVCGAAPAANPGGMRALLTGMVNEQNVPQALSAEAILTEIIWMAAPALVVLLALQASRSAPLGLAAGCAAVAAAGILLITPRVVPDERAEGAEEVQPKRAKARALARVWPIYVTSAAALSLVAGAELALPALLEFRHIAVGASGVLLSAFAAVSALGAYAYGLRSWPGAVRMRSMVFLFATAAGIALTAVLPTLAGITVGILLAGLCQSVVMVTRNLSLRERLPGRLHASGYSIMYAIQGIGYSATAVLIAFALARSTPSVAILTGVGFTLLLSTISAMAELRREPPLAVPS